MNAADVIASIETIAPLSGALPWDNCGVQIAGTRDDVKRVAVTLDPKPQSMAEAVAWGADLILTHHPLYMEPKPLSQAGYFLDSARAVISSGAWLYAAHTSLDAQPSGPAGWLFRALKLSGLRVLEPTDQTQPDVGLGFVGQLPQPQSWDAFAQQLAALVPRDYWTLTGNPSEQISTVAYCTGSGGSLLDDALAAGADVFVTGDLKYHQALESSCFAVDVGHFSLEETMTSELAKLLETKLGPDAVEVRFLPGRDPFSVHLPRTSE